jgi:hypothetical protein
MEEAHAKLLVSAKLKRISSYVDELLASIDTMDCCDFRLLESVNSINITVTDMYDYITTKPVETEDEEDDSEEEGETELELAIKEE